MPERLKTPIIRISSFLLLTLVFIASNHFSIFAQGNEPAVDTMAMPTGPKQEIRDSSERDPGKAALYSAILPGMGQYYNKRYWKIPIVYAGFGTFGYFISRNSLYYKDLKQKLIDPEYEMKYFKGDFTPDQLNRGKDLYKRWRDLSIIGTAGFYVFQIIDATVDAYLFDWDVGEDISMRIEPAASPMLNPLFPVSSFGLSACISF